MHPTSTIGAYDAVSNTGVVALHDCGPNGATVGPAGNLLLGCTPQNVPSNTTTQVINGKTKNTANIVGITGSDEVWYNAGDNRYYTGSSRACGSASGCPSPAGGAALGVIDGTSVLIEKIPQSQNSHSVAADSKRNLIFVPQVGSFEVVGSGGDTTTVGAGNLRRRSPQRPWVRRGLFARRGPRQERQGRTRRPITLKSIVEKAGGSPAFSFMLWIQAAIPAQQPRRTSGLPSGKARS